MASEIWLDLHPKSTYRPCEACKAPLTFRRGEKGTWVPLDLSTIRKNKKGAWEAQSHYQTCTDPKRFSRQGKR